MCSCDHLSFQLHAISEFMKKPVPMVDITGSRFDISPILELCSQLECIYVTGGTKSYLESNIVLNKLQYELSPFKVNYNKHIQTSI